MKNLNKKHISALILLVITLTLLILKCSKQVPVTLTTLQKKEEKKQTQALTETVEEEDLIADYIANKDEANLKIMNSCLGMEFYSMAIDDIMGVLSEGKYSAKDLEVISKNIHAVSAGNETFRFLYKRIPYQSQNKFELKIVKEHPEFDFETVDYDGDDNIEEVKKYFKIEKVIFNNQAQSFTKDGMTVYFIKENDHIAEMNVAIKNKLVQCQLKEELRCLCLNP